MIGIETGILDKIKEETLLKEMQHRMKNNLQLILSLINIQLLKNIDETNKDFLHSLKQRVDSLSQINNLLDYSFNESSINLGELINCISENVMSAYKKRNDIILMKYIENIEVEHQFAIPLGLIVNELLTNSYKYAFPVNGKFKGKNYCKIEVILRKINDKYELIISDNGISINNNTDSKRKNSSGVKLVQTFISQIDGEYQLDVTDGTSYKITF
ncbi:MAG: sensor histidine kinase [Bacteroidetes bacterium]|nr:sensor histidine kinase [Bacteroidota bacterium]